MKKTFTLLSVAFTLLMATSCESNTHWDKTFVNSSTHTLVLYTTDGGGGFTFADSLIIAPGTEEIIYSFSDVVNDGAPACEQYINRLSLVAEEGFTVNKDITDSDNWIDDTIEESHGFNHNCTFTIADADIL
jgi:hypothetical protein